MSEWIVKQNTDGQLEIVGLLVRCENCKKAKTCERYFTNGLKNGYCDRGEADAYSKKVCTYNETGCGSCKLQTKCPADEPTVDAVPVRHAKWEDRTDNDDHYVYCSECGDEYIENDLRLDSWVKRYFKYCPNCGARMDKK